MADSFFRGNRTLIAAGLLLLTSFVASTSSAAWIDPLTPEERQGRTLYHYGEGGPPDNIRVNLQGVEGGIPPSLFRCAGCHGHRGEGIQEGGLRVPSLTPMALRQVRGVTQAGRSRSAYSDEALAKAITQGIDASDQALHPSMPRYQLTSRQVAALIAYLKRIGEEVDTDPGVSSSTVTVGAALPLSGPLAQIGRDVEATLRGSFRRQNERGGVYGRQIELIVEDSRDDPAQTVKAMTRLIEYHQVFALVGSFEPAGEPGILELLQRHHIPLIFPLTQSPQISDPPNPYVFYALPGFDLQFRSLLDYFASRAPLLTGSARPRLALVYRNGAANSEALRGALAQVRRHGLSLAVNYEYPPGRLAAVALVAQLEQQGIDAVLFMGDGEDLVSMGNELVGRGLTPVLLSAAGMVGPQVRALPSSLLSRVFLVTPLDPPTERDVTYMRELSGRDTLSSIGFARMAQGAASILVQALMQAGRRLSRHAAMEALESFNDQGTGAGFSATFGAHRRLGHVASKVVGVMQSPPYFSPLTGWMVPEGGQ